ncbi:hypothetical protein [Sporomusa termitida]|uniref:Uncharacterized protein n=1 Tax=Sporomusa termitida TaxID=2377 RepID=A0A517DXS4_9FIRM|nr:hypothetical protein [Sporomusa termitida]QDR82155.1 hypothetical protein SPTER_35760 [Sporomusa termitida]
MKLKAGFLKRILLTAMTLSIIGSSAVQAAPENLFGYTVVDSGYSQGLAGAISGERTGNPTTFTSSTKVTGLNGDPAIFNFFQGNESRLVLREYNYTPTAPPNRIIDPFAASWNPLVSPSWSNVANLHAVATKNQWLYATGYDLAKIAVVNMNSGYAQTAHNYQFPTSWPSISVPAGAAVHGEGLTVVDNNLYALFTINPDGGYSVYSNSIVVKFTINTITGALTYVNHLEVGKNAFTLDHYNNKLYVCAVGGMQNAGSANPDTRLDIIDLATFTKTTVTKTSGMIGDFRDITIVDANTAYVFLGNYNASFANMLGNVYRTTVANLTSPSTWTNVSTINSPGYLWGIYGDSTRFWFVKGNQIDIYPGLPASTGDTATRTFTPTQLGYSGGNLNSAIILAPDLTSRAGAALQSAGVAKSFAAHSVLAQQARKAAEKKTGLKIVNGQRILSFD